MFGLFKKKEAGIKVNDKVWVSSEAKWKACIEIIRSNSETIFIAWFDESLEQLEEIFRKENVAVENILSARQATSQLIQNKNVVLIEHYPLRTKEQALFRQLNQQEVQIFSSLDEPVFKQLGSDKIVTLMKQLGMQETEVIEHSMISNAISSAQEKIAAKITVDQLARSQTEWFSKNFPG